MESKRTRSCRAIYISMSILHVVLLIAPFLYFFPFSLHIGDKVEKITLAMSSLVAAILVVMSIILDVTHRAGLHKTALWLVIAGITTCIGSISTIFIWIMAAISIADELVIMPIRNKYRLLLISNKEIDKRETGSV